MLTNEQRLINYLVDNTVDFAAIGRRLAKESPATFLSLIDGELNDDHIRQKYSEFLTCLRQGNRVGAIKGLRNITGFGLKNAMDIGNAVLGAAVDAGVTLHPGISEGPMYLRELEQRRAEVYKAGNTTLLDNLTRVFLQQPT